MQNQWDKLIDQDCCKKYTVIKKARKKTTFDDVKMCEYHTVIKKAQKKTTYGKFEMSEDHTSTGIKKARNKATIVNVAVMNIIPV